MKEFQIAIAYHEVGFSKHWIKYCEENGIGYKIVNCYESDIISRLSSANALLWHWNHESAVDSLIARNIIRAAELMGLKVFPNTATCWSFDDKVAQKYILEAIGAPLVPTYVFFDRRSAMNWVDRVSFPKVFKLRKGAGSRNVRLVRSKKEARSLVKQAFGRGFKPVGSTGRFMRDMAVRTGTSSWRQRLDMLGKIKRFPERLQQVYRTNKQMGREYGYVYFQDFIPDNLFDTRIIVAGDRYAFGFTRNVRRGDFRASGSGSIDYNRDRINPKCIRIAFEVAEKLSTQSIAFDFVIDRRGEPLIIEMSYGFPAHGAVSQCAGYWDKQLQWHEGHMWPQDVILINLLEDLRQREEQDTGKDIDR